MLMMTNTFAEAGCCALCQYWYGEAVESYCSQSGSVIYDGSVDDGCQYHKKWTFADECCTAFVLDVVYRR